MPEQIRALIVVIVLAGAVFLIARRPACDRAMEERDFARRRNLWFIVTLLAFLASNFWLLMVVAGVVVFLAGRREHNVMALYLLLLFAVPPFSASISGFGLVNQILALDYPRLLSIVLLLPAAFSLRRLPAEERAGRFLLPDYLIAAYLLLQLGRQYTVDSFTNTGRYAIYALLDVGLPYYVASRALRSVEAFREAAMSLVIACLVMAVIAMFETPRHWLLYSSLDRALNVKWGMGNYLGRNDLLRAQVSTGQPIVLGYVLSIALVVLAYLRRSVDRAALWWLASAALLGGLVASFSRGPWIGAAVALLVFRLTGPKAVGGLFKATALLAVVGAVVMVSPIGSTVMPYLPFVGDVGAGTITYRQTLLEASIRVIRLNPWFGSFDFLARPAFDELRQNQAGFVDLVNTYVGISLADGLVGLTFFVGAFIASGSAAFRCMWRLAEQTDETHVLGQVLLACLAGTMVTIFTVSSISFIPILYWTVVGMAVGYADMLRRQGAETPADSEEIEEPQVQDLRLRTPARTS